MSDADATDPVKALREFTALRDTTREFVVDGIEPPRGFLDDTGGHAAARAVLSAAPALLARIEAGEAERKDILDRIAETPLDYASAYETLKDIARDYEVGVYAPAKDGPLG